MIQIAPRKLKAIANKFRVELTDIEIIIQAIGKAMDSIFEIGWGAKTGEEQNHEILSDLYYLFEAVSKCRSAKKLKSIINKHIEGIDWDNWYHDQSEDDEAAGKEPVPFTLGSVWYSRLEGIAADTSEEVVQEVCSHLSETIKPYLDALEKLK